jgi:hypothetical protein
MRSPVSLPFLAALVLAIAPLAASPAVASAPIASVLNAVTPGPADAVTWSVKPSSDSKGARASFEYGTDPGTQVNDTVIVINSGTVAGDFMIYAADAINDRSTGELSLLPKDTKSSDLGSWIALDVPTLHLEPGTQATIPFTMLIPSDASPGDHSAGIVASSVTKGSSKGQAVIIDQRVGARVNLRVSGAVAPKVAATGFVTGFSPSLNPFAPGTVTVDYSVVNRGNIRLDVTQKIDIVGPFGIHLGTLTPSPVNNLLPGQAAHKTALVSGVGALALAWTNVTLKPGPVGGSTERTDPRNAGDTSATDEKIDPDADVQFAPASATSLSVAVTWTLMALFVLLAAIIFFVARYVRTTRATFYAAIDQANAEAREGAAREAELSETVSTR